MSAAGDFLFSRAGGRRRQLLFAPFTMSSTAIHCAGRQKALSWKGVSHMSLMENEGRLLAAVYAEGMLVSVRVREDRSVGRQPGGLSRDTGPRKDRQEASHPHFRVKWMQGNTGGGSWSRCCIYHCNRTEWFGKRGKMDDRVHDGRIGPRYFRDESLRRHDNLITDTIQCNKKYF